MSLLSLPRRLAFALAVCFFMAPAFAQPAGAHADNFLYRVISGDTLIDLAQKFTDNPANWTTLQALNSVQDPTRLVIGSELKIPFSLIPELPSQAHVSHSAGQVSANGNPLKETALLVEGDTITTGSAGFLTMILADGSVLSVPAASSLLIQRLRVFKGTGLTDTVFTMSNGSLESSVAPQDTGVGRFEIRTPVSITGVRGTRLRVRTSSGGSQSEVLSGNAQLSSGHNASARLHRDQGAAVNAHGKLLGVRPLLPAPALPPPERGGQGWNIAFPPVPGAVSYLVRVAANDTGSDLVSSHKFSSPEITFSAPGAGTYYVVVRAVDADGVMGKDAVQSFPGRSLLKTSDGLAVLGGQGQFVLLTEY